MANSRARRHRFQTTSAEARALLASGESGRAEFKRDADAVHPRTLAALANWVALEDGRGAAILLVGVDEVEDGETGLVAGVPCGLPKGLDRSVARLQDMASRTKPIPVDLFIVEEAAKTKTPFLRIEVRPTMPPHFDDEGRRQTRQGRSTRALTDEELLQTYLARESGAFGQRFQQAARELQAAVGVIGAQVDQIGQAVEETIARPIEELTETARAAAAAAHAADSSAGYASSAADAASAAADTTSYEVERAQQLLQELQEVVEEVRANSVDNLVSRVIHARREVWWAFTVDTYERTSAQAQKLTADLHGLLSVGVFIDDAHNTWELAVWRDLLRDRKRQRSDRGTLKWWRAHVSEVTSFLDDPRYQAPDLPDIRGELQVGVDAALDNPDSLTNMFSKLLRS